MVSSQVINDIIPKLWKILIQINNAGDTNIPFWIDEAITYYISQINGLKSNNNNRNTDDSIIISFINQILSNKFQALSFAMPVARYETGALILQVLLNCMMQNNYLHHYVKMKMHQ